DQSAHGTCPVTEASPCSRAVGRTLAAPRTRFRALVGRGDPHAVRERGEQRSRPQPPLAHDADLLREHGDERQQVDPCDEAEDEAEDAVRASTMPTTSPVPLPVSGCTFLAQLAPD